jgi:hypothetical protein
VREETTRKLTYRDKSWWFGFELSGGLFVFENPYSSIAVYLEASERVCSLQLHTLRTKSYFWNNGSLLKNKAIDVTTFEFPTH